METEIGRLLSGDEPAALDVVLLRGKRHPVVLDDRQNPDSENLLRQTSAVWILRSSAGEGIYALHQFILSPVQFSDVKSGR